MTQNTRRTFMMQVAACGGLLAGTQAMAQAAKADEKDPQAVGIGYVADTTKVDKKNTANANHKPEQRCDNCALYAAAQAKDGYAPCPLVGNKLVAAKGWCRAYAKKA